MDHPKADSFHLISFETPEFSLPLFDNADFVGGPKASVIIGPNGSNKSRVLSLLIDELSNIDGLRKQLNPSKAIDFEKPTAFKVQQYSLFPDEPQTSRENIPDRPMRARFDAKISYQQDGHHWVVERTSQRLRVWKDSHLVDPSSFAFPDRAIAVAHLPTDRYKFIRNQEHGFYAYLGLRQNTNMTTTGALETKVVLGFIEAIKRARAIDIFKHWFAELEIEMPATIEIGLSRRRYYETGSFEEFQHEVLSQIERTRGRQRELTQEEGEGLAELWQFILSLRDYPLHRRQARKKYYPRAFGVSFELGQLPEIFDTHDVSKMLEIGRRLRVFSDISLLFRKNDMEVQFSDLSSGEQQILGTIIRFVAELGGHSVVVIDEPEVSLHPAWQRMYLPRLLETLQSFPQTHAIIATHSHFMVSDVSDKFASLTIADRNADRLFEPFEGDVYGRSPENILYRAFGIATTSNFYVERDLTKALRIISGVDEMNMLALNTIYQRLQVLDAEDNEALGEILTRIKMVLDREIQQ
ncbi:AAA family ATPase [uncultured Tateyamaria sp.]|uniref:AAA family ATPase n=1 Tax=uncultured Tateyamaria sp. TaxID=455651 RepID=UPI0026159F9C|nr:AAA family ATPase [uncultured Tateyamaria sp.]